MLKEFKEFALKGNLIDLAVGFVMGTAFATVVKAFIDGMFMPLLSPILGGVDLAAWKWQMSPAVLDAAGVITKPAVLVDVGGFVSAVITFTIVSFVMFMIIKGMNKMKLNAPAPPPVRQEVLLEEIRNLLAKGR
jgi:large conductance mechanosensitive channel